MGKILHIYVVVGYLLSMANIIKLVNNAITINVITWKIEIQLTFLSSYFMKIIEEMDDEKTKIK